MTHIGAYYYDSKCTNHVGISKLLTKLFAIAALSRTLVLGQLIFLIFNYRSVNVT